MGTEWARSTLQHLLPALPALLHGALVVGRRIARLAGAHEAVAGAGIDDGVELLLGLLHGRGGGLDPGRDARVLLAVEAVHGASDGRERGLVLGRAAVEDVRGSEVL